MKPNLLLRLGIVSFSCLLPLRAADPDLREQLRDALYTEEVTRDPEKAAKQYEQILARHDEQQAFAASALFRLAEVRRKQNRKDDAITLYQRLIAEFPKADAETRLAKENLTALGGKMPETEMKPASVNEEDKELARLEAEAKSSPDMLLDSFTFELAARNGHAKIVKRMLAAGCKPFERDALRYAAADGNLEIVKLLTSQPDPVPETNATEAIWRSIDSGRLTVLDFLLEKGLKPGKVPAGNGMMPVLTQALLENRISSAEILLKHGVDLNEMAVPGSDPQFNQCGSALQFSVRDGKLDAVKWLLAKGAKPDIADPVYGLTPLHDAAKSERTEALEMMKLLLDAGADPNRVSLDRPAPDSLAKTILLNASPLETSIASRSMALEKTKLLLEHKADPNRKDSRVSSMLVTAIGLNDPTVADLVQLLGEKGVRMNDPVLMESAIRNKNPKLIGMLLKYGALPPASLLANGFREINHGEIKGMLVRSFLFPKWLEESAIHLVYPDSGADVVLAGKTGDERPDSLAKLLLDKDGREKGGPPNKFENLVIHRRKGADATETIRVAIAAPEPYPQLEWGDVIEIEMTDKSYEGVLGFGWESGTGWALRRHLSFPVEVEVSGVTKQLLVRGDRLTYDPSKAEVPWLGAGGVMKLVWNPDCPLVRPGDYAVIIKRSGWPDVRLVFDDRNTERFPLQTGDKLVLDLPADHDKRVEESRRFHASVNVAGQVRSYGKPTGDVFPTLLQAIADVYAPWQSKSFENEYARRPHQIGSSLMWNLRVPVDLPYPDLSRIRLRRLGVDGNEELKIIDLERIIKETAGKLTVAEAKSADVDLMAGDIVELSLLSNPPKPVWKGFSPEQERFFALALGCRFKVFDGKGQLSLKDCRWVQPDWKITEGGLLPFPPDAGNSSLRASGLDSNSFSLQGQPIRLIRDGKTHERIGLEDVFVKDGDEISSALQSRSRN